MEPKINNLTPRSKRLLEMACNVAREYNHDYVGVEHIFIAIIRLGEGVASNIILQSGITENTMRRELDPNFNGDRGTLAECISSKNDIQLIQAHIQILERSASTLASSSFCFKSESARSEIEQRVNSIAKEIIRLSKMAYPN